MNAPNAQERARPNRDNPHRPPHDGGGLHRVAESNARPVEIDSTIFFGRSCQVSVLLPQVSISDRQDPTRGQLMGDARSRRVYTGRVADCAAADRGRVELFMASARGFGKWPHSGSVSARL
jgi:hypothetical protein